MNFIGLIIHLYLVPQSSFLKYYLKANFFPQLQIENVMLVVCHL
jgi:hypothetical protein